MTRLKRDKIYKDSFIGVRCMKEQHNEIKMRANLYTEGNVSEYVIYAALNFAPCYEDLESEELDEEIKRMAKRKN